MIDGIQHLDPYRGDSQPYTNEPTYKALGSMVAKDKQVGGDHYQTPIQPIEYIHANKLGYIEGNVVKYVTRHRQKNGRQDIEKAIHYLELLLELEYGDT